MREKKISLDGREMLKEKSESLDAKQLNLLLAGALAASAALGLCACNEESTGASDSQTMSVLDIRDTVVVRDTVVIKEPSSGDSRGPGNDGETSPVNKANWTYLNTDINYGEITDESDGQVYKTVKIGGQTWMAENLNFEYKVDGKTYGVYTADSLKVFGYYYTWAAAMDSAGVFGENGKGCGYGVECSPKQPVRGVCPKDWHLPENDEWKRLYRIVDSRYTVMQALGFDKWEYASNTSGFSALPAGIYDNVEYDGIFRNVGFETFFWSASVYTAVNARTGSAYRWNLYAGNANLNINSRKYGYSVRCLKD